MSADTEPITVIVCACVNVAGAGANILSTAVRLSTAALLPLLWPTDLHS